MRTGESGWSLLLLILLNGGVNGLIKAQLNDLKRKFFSFNFHFVSGLLKGMNEEGTNECHKDTSLL